MQKGSAPVLSKEGKRSAYVFDPDRLRYSETSRPRPVE